MTKTPFLVVTVALAMGACDSVAIDDERLVPPRGVIKGTVLYQGPHPCTQSGHVVGNVILLIFDRKNPPPPAGIATIPSNFGLVSGDTLFANEPRTSGDDRVCPTDPTAQITASAPFAVSPFDAGQYIVQGFYDVTGNFLPTFKFRNLPERGDIGGGYLDTTDAAKHAGDINYSPLFLPVNVGVPAPQPVAPGAPTLVMPREGFVADNIAVTLGLTLPLTRPYFYPDGADRQSMAPTMTPANPSGDSNYVPVVTMAQDHQLLAPPQKRTQDTINAFQGAFVSVRLNWGLPASELPYGTSPLQPFHLQTLPFEKGGGLFIWAAGGLIPEGNGVPSLYPLGIFSKLASDPAHDKDPQSIRAQASAAEPFVVLQGITLAGEDSLLSMVLTPPLPKPSEEGRSDHVTLLLRPSVICFDPAHPDAGGVLVTPHLKGASADPMEVVPPEGKDLFDAALVLKSQGKRVRKVALGCLPTGRYAINLVYPAGQAWTVPNEAGSCAVAEGPADNLAPFPGVLGCSKKPRPILYSQGPRAVLEIVPPFKPEGVQYCKDHPPPPECLKNAL